MQEIFTLNNCWKTEEEKEDAIHTLFILEEIKRAISKPAPGKDQMCFIILNHRSDLALEVILHLDNKRKITQTLETSSCSTHQETGKRSH